MSFPFPLLPESASTVATEVDLLYLFITAVCAFFAVLVTVLVFVFAIKFKRKHADDVGADIHGSLILELTWTFIPFVLAMGMFVWGADLFFRLTRPPADAMDVFVVGKQWMWKVQHPSGVREINELHVPVGRPIRLTMGSEDVLHDYFIPAMRVKMDVVPGKLTTMWFTATKPGTYHLFCAEYCGTKHSGMIGQVTVMPPQEYEAWIAANQPAVSLAEAGRRVFEQGQQCSVCHKEDGGGRGPSLAGLFGRTVQLADGRSVAADENYLRESIMNPSAKIVRGFSNPSIMPTFQGTMSEERLIELIAYLKTLRSASGE